MTRFLLESNRNLCTLSALTFMCPMPVYIPSKLGTGKVLI
jgi:hypothetical protein